MSGKKGAIRIKNFRLSEDDAKKFEADAKLHNLSDSNYFRKLVEQGLVKKPKGMKELMLDCEAFCYRCKQKLKPGDHVFYSGKIGIICQNCIDPSKSSKTLVRKDLALIEKKRTNKAYDEEIAEQREIYLKNLRRLEDLSFAEGLARMRELLEKFDGNLERFLGTSGDPYGLKKEFQEWRTCFQEIKILKKQQQSQLLKHIKLPEIPKKKKKSKKTKQQYA